MKIFAVDDSDIARTLIAAALAEAGYDDVALFESGAELIRQLDEGLAQPDLLLLDVLMPEMDGIELCARMREDERMARVPIIMLTADSEIATLDQALLAGANDYLTKPFQQVELLARVRGGLKLKAERDRRLARDRQVAELRRKAATDGGGVPGPCGLVAFPALEAALGARLAALEGRGDGAVCAVAVKMPSLAAAEAGEAVGAADSADLERIAGALAGAPGRAGDLLAYSGGGVFICVASRPGRAECEALRLGFGETARLIAPQDDALAIVRGVTASVGLAVSDAGDEDEATVNPAAMIADAIVAADAELAASGARQHRFSS